ncbi:MAG: NUDIX hydrolase [Lachnospiraceae bacterium]|nr:NUDIX hydrolase [Lachnospiraceae bacterium]
MKLQGIIKREQGQFINRYDLVYETQAGRKKVYEIISRRKELLGAEDLKGETPDAVVIIVTDEYGERILLNKEFRMAVNDWVYHFPAGLIDPGETPLESAKRELWEETGLELYEVEDMLAPSYSAVSFGNESNVCIVGRARGRVRPSTSDAEEIVAGWYTKEEVRALLNTERFAARTQAYCYIWSK